MAVKPTMNVSKAVLACAEVEKMECLSFCAPQEPVSCGAHCGGQYSVPHPGQLSGVHDKVRQPRHRRPGAQDYAGTRDRAGPAGPPNPLPPPIYIVRCRRPGTAVCHVAGCLELLRKPVLILSQAKIFVGINNTNKMMRDKG